MTPALYRGRRADGAIVEYRRESVDWWSPLPLRLDLWNHSPSGFEWGYGGSGPAQLALSLLAHHLRTTGQDADSLAVLAVRYHQHFKAAIVARLPHLGWQLESDDIAAWIALHETVEGLADGR